jgi:hypothetical protein
MADLEEQNGGLLKTKWRILKTIEKQNGGS